MENIALTTLQTGPLLAMCNGRVLVTEQLLLQSHPVPISLPPARHPSAARIVIEYTHIKMTNRNQVSYKCSSGESIFFQMIRVIMYIIGDEKHLQRP